MSVKMKTEEQHELNPPQQERNISPVIIRRKVITTAGTIEETAEEPKVEEVTAEETVEELTTTQLNGNPQELSINGSSREPVSVNSRNIQHYEEQHQFQQYKVEQSVVKSEHLGKAKAYQHAQEQPINYTATGEIADIQGNVPHFQIEGSSYGEPQEETEVRLEYTNLDSVHSAQYRDTHFANNGNEYRQHQPQQHQQFQRLANTRDLGNNPPNSVLYKNDPNLSSPTVYPNSYEIQNSQFQNNQVTLIDHIGNSYIYSVPSNSTWVPIPPNYSKHSTYPSSSSMDITSQNVRYQNFSENVTTWAPLENGHHSPIQHVDIKECVSCGDTNGNYPCNACGFFERSNCGNRPTVRTSEKPACTGNRRNAVICVNCGTSSTTLWRRNNQGQSVCNACGLYYKLHGINRPPSMKKGGIISTRKRKPKNVGSNRNHLMRISPDVSGVALQSPTSTMMTYNSTSEERIPQVIPDQYQFPDAIVQTNHRIRLPSADHLNRPMIANSSPLELMATHYPVDQEATVITSTFAANKLITGTVHRN